MSDPGVLNPAEQIETLRRELLEAREALDAIRSGEVDALVVSSPGGERIFTLEGSDFAYRALVEQMAEGAATLSRDGIVVFANESLARMLGRPIDVLLGKPFTGFLREESRGAFEKALAASARSESPVGTRVDLDSGPETSLPATVSARTFNIGGSPTISLTVVDLTEHLALARVEATWEAEERYRLAIEATRDAIWDLDLVGGSVLVNEAADAVIGLPPAGVTPLQWWIERLHPEDRDRASSSLQAAIDGPDLTWQCEYRLRKLDGSWASIFDRAYIVRDPSGRALRLIGAMQDLTERLNSEEALRTSEARFRLLAWTADRLLAETDPQAFVEQLCRVVMEHLQCDVFFNFLADEQAGRLHLNAWAGVSGDVAREMEWLDYGGTVCGCAARDRARVIAEDILRSDDPRAAMVRRFGLQAYCCHPIVAQGKLLGTLSFGTRERPRLTESELDLMRIVTDQVAAAMQRVLAEKALREAGATLERRVAERTAEVEALVVRLRELASELTDAEMRERRRVARILHDHFQQILVAAKLQVGVIRARTRGNAQRSSAQLADDLLTEAIQASRTLAVELSPPVLHEAGLLAGLDWLIRRMKDQHGLEVSLSADPDVEPGTDHVRAFVFEAVRELLFNVVKHSGSREASLVVRRGNGQIEVRVEDAGPGLRPTRSQTDAGSVSGFGLFSISQRLELLGGSLLIEKAGGSGTRVDLNIPLERPAWPRSGETASPPLPKSARRAGASRKRGGDRVRVVLADDHRIVRQGFVSLLESDGEIEVVGQAADGAEALDLAQSLLPDVVVMDVSMPKMNGVDATRWITANLPGVRVIGLSMHDEEQTARAMREAGAVAYVTKDGPSAALVAAIHDAMVTVAGEPDSE